MPRKSPAEDQFFLAHVAEPTRILGLDLRPFALGHLVLLHFTHNAYVTGDPISLDDLVSGVFICSQTYREMEAILTTGMVDVTTRNRFGRERTRKVPLPEAMASWQKQVGDFDFAAKSKEFMDYTERGSRHPTVSTTRGFTSSTMPNACPFVQSVKVFLMSRMNFREEEILDRSWSLCLWDYFTARSHDGDLKIVDTDLIEEAQALADSLQEKLDKGEIRIVPGQMKDRIKPQVRTEVPRGA